MSNRDNDDPEDDNYYLESEEDVSLGPDEFDILRNPSMILGYRLSADD